VLFGGIVFGLLRGWKPKSFGFMIPLRAVLDGGFAGKPTFLLQQTQLAGTRYSFGATLNL